MTNKVQLLLYLFVLNQLYMFRVMFLPIIRSTWLYLQLLIQSTMLLLAGVMDKFHLIHDTGLQQHSTEKVLRSTYFSYAHSIMSYGLIFWGNSTDSDDIFKIQKRIIRIITNSNKNASCRELFKKLNILPLQSQYIYSTLLFITKNKDQFFPNSHIHTINTRHNNNLFVPAANLTLPKRCLLLRN